MQEVYDRQGWGPSFGSSITQARALILFKFNKDKHHLSTVFGGGGLCEVDGKDFFKTGVYTIRAAYVMN